jgi:hypothetical protein
LTRPITEVHKSFVAPEGKRETRGIEVPGGGEEERDLLQAGIFF